MKEFHTGDKVRFISTKGCGIVTSVNKNVINVLIEDGFVIPIDAADLIVIDPETEKKNPFLKKNEFDNIAANQQQSNLSAEKKERKKEGYVEDRKAKYLPTKGLYIAYIPNNQENLIIGDLDLYLINYTNWQIAYSLLSLDTKLGYKNTSSGLISSGEAVFIDCFSHNKINQKNKIQILCLDTEGGNIFEAEVVEFDIKPAKLLREDIYTKNVFFDERGYVLLLHNLERPTLFENKKNLIEKTNLTNKNSFIEKYVVSKGFAEVDLHIEKLRNDYKSMDKHDIMKTQISFFRQCLDDAISSGLSRIVFIHGVGVGLLKKEISDVLKLYTDIDFCDASILKYGIGATEVQLKK